MSSKGKSDQDVTLKLGDNTVQKQCEVAEILAEYFSRIAEDIGDIPNNFPNDNITNHDSVNKIKEKHRANTFEFCKIEYDEVLSTLKNSTLTKLRVLI